MSRHFPWPVYAAMYRAAVGPRIVVGEGAELYMKCIGDVQFYPSQTGHPTILVKGRPGMPAGTLTIDLRDSPTTRFKG